ncbi:nuclease [Flavonifractor plautii]|uniref:NYN domain-containing protein n=1 Tax=Flavonifractor plautii TaxID=292800 RepID=A0AAX1KM21_FLAPL|nr:NYN domain-containing protein [Flavonifractor plautii]ANU40216.1 nuclease [Flavonifractor plautii]OXE47041.1 nuclease [Flavonifractor plautii]QQR07012.1 NYN domain-containing protein [Flavonifractor plautii]UQA27783.1 NYN domain-containing protein [Flavonifractor plautii]
MSKTAILVDGGFYRKRAKSLWGEHSARDTANGLITYVYRHLRERSIIHDLYRIFYYDCPPVSKQMYHPLFKKTVNLGATSEYAWMCEFLDCLKEKRKVALRLGVLDDNNSVYTLTYDSVKKLCAGSLSITDLSAHNFDLTIRQKGVDMKIGMDIASLSYKHQVDQIVLIAGDSDFVPAAKLARREGLDFVLDPLEMDIGHDKALFEHIDGKRSCGNPYGKEKSGAFDQYKV